MEFTRIRLPKNVSSRLTQLKMKTGLNANVLIRYGLMLSLKDPSNPIYEEQHCDGLELHRSVLLGELDGIVCALIRQRYEKSPQYGDSFICFKAHLYRGVDMLAASVVGLGGVAKIIKDS